MDSPETDNGLRIRFDGRLSFRQMLLAYVALEKFYQACGADTPLPCSLEIDDSLRVPRGELEQVLSEDLTAGLQDAVLIDVNYFFPRDKWHFEYPIALVLRHLQNYHLGALLSKEDASSHTSQGSYGPLIPKVEVSRSARVVEIRKL